MRGVMSPMRNSVEGDGPVNHFLLMRPQSLSHFVGELSLCDPLTQISLHTAKNLKLKATVCGTAKSHVTFWSERCCSMSRNFAIVFSCISVLELNAVISYDVQPR